VVDALRLNFATCGIPEELATDGGLEFTGASSSRTGAYTTVSVLWPFRTAIVGPRWESSQSRLLAGDIILFPSGSLNMDAFQHAVPQYRITPDPTTKMSPAMRMFGRPVRDLIPVKPGKYAQHKMSLSFEQALSHRYVLADSQWSEHSKPLPHCNRTPTCTCRTSRPKHWD
jgi:hypothetical protein